MRFPQLCLLVSSTVCLASAFNIGVLSDIHILPIYDPNVNNTCYCSANCPALQNISPLLQSNDYAPLGRLNCDPPQDLTEAAIQRLKQEQPNLDLLIVTGDIVGHTYA